MSIKLKTRRLDKCMAFTGNVQKKTYFRAYRTTTC
jgi:hypothetical protein